MKDYVYRWSLRQEMGLVVEVRVTAPSVIVARREIHAFLLEYDGSTWTLESISREAQRAPDATLALLHESVHRA